MLEAGACVHRCPEARLSLEAGAGAQRPDVLEAGVCVHRCPEARLSLEAGWCPEARRAGGWGLHA